MQKQQWKNIKKDIDNFQTNNTTIYVFLFDVLLILISWLLKINGVWLLSCPVLLLAMMHMYLIMHEAIHKSVSRNKLINDIVGHICSLVILLPFLPRQRNHLGHHVWAGHPMHDPENSKLIQKYSVISDKEAARMDQIWKSWLPLIAFNHIIATWRDPFVKLKNEPNGMISRFKKEAFWARCYIAIHIIILSLFACFGSLGLFFSWFLPSWFFFLMFIELANLPHHAETPLLNKDDDALPIWYQDTISHNCAIVPFWSTYIMLNFNLHIAHHQFPTVPWYNLPKVQELTDVNLFNESEFSWAIKNRRRSLIEIMGHYFDKRKI